MKHRLVCFASQGGAFLQRLVKRISPLVIRVVSIEKVAVLEMTDRTLLVFRAPQGLSREQIECISTALGEKFGKGRCLILPGCDLVCGINLPDTKAGGVL